MVPAALTLYIGLLLVVGLWSSRRTRGVDDYFFAGRRVGGVMLFFTLTASWFGAASMIVTVDHSRESGFSALWIMAIPTLLTLVSFIVLNSRIRASNFISLPDFLGRHYGKATAKLSSWLIFFYMVLLAASQFVAWGRLTKPFLQLPGIESIWIGALVVIIYSHFGGYLSVIRTDGIQFLLITAAMVSLLVRFGKQTIQLQPADVSMFTEIDTHLLMTLSFTLAWIVSPIVWQRIASARSAKSSRAGLFFSLPMLAGLSVGAVWIGLAMRNYPQQTFFSVLTGELSSLPFFLVITGIISAIMSTADSALNLAGLTLTRDIMPARKSDRQLPAARIATTVSGVIAVVTAVKFQSILLTLGLASEIIAEGLFIPCIAALLFHTRSKRAGLFSLCAGGSFAILVFLKAYGLPLPLPSWPQSVPLGLTLSALGFLLGLWLDRRSSRGVGTS